MHTRPFLRRCAGAAWATALAALPVASTAALPDEIQVYTDAFNPPGKRSLEVHVNTTPRGNLEQSFPGERITHHGLRVTPEFALGITPTFEAGLYLPMVFDASLHGELAGIKPRLKWLPVRPRDGESGWFAGINLELSRVARKFDEARTNLEMRNIIGWRGRDWSLAINPVLGWGLTSGHRGAPEFKLAARVMRRLGNGVSAGLEHYGEYGPANRFAPSAERARTLFAVAEFELPRGWALHFGIGRGDGPADPWTVKSILSIGL